MSVGPIGRSVCAIFAALNSTWLHEGLLPLKAFYLIWHLNLRMSMIGINKWMAAAKRVRAAETETKCIGNKEVLPGNYSKITWANSLSCKNICNNTVYHLLANRVPIKSLHWVGLCLVCQVFPKLKTQLEINATAEVLQAQCLSLWLGKNFCCVVYLSDKPSNWGYISFDHQEPAATHQVI